MRRDADCFTESSSVSDTVVAGMREASSGAGGQNATKAARGGAEAPAPAKSRENERDRRAHAFVGEPGKEGFVTPYLSETAITHSVARKLALAVQRLDSAIVIGDAEGHVEWVNQAFTRLSGYALEEVAGKRLKLFRRDPEADEAAIEHVRARFLRSEGTQLEVAIPTKSGGTIWLALEVQPLCDEGTRPTSFFAIATDITDRKRAQEALAESEARYRALVELSPEPIAVHSEGRIAYINPAAAQLLGASSTDELLGRPILDVVHPDYHAIVAERVRKMQELGEPALLQEERFVRLDGEVLDAEVVAAPITWQGRPAIQIMARDVTERRRGDLERRQLESRLQETQRLESLGALAGGIARDFDAFLAAILESSDEAVMALPASTPVAARVREIRRTALRASALTRQMSAFAGQSRLKRRPLDLSALVIDSSSLLESGVDDGRRIHYNLDGNLPLVDADAVQLRQGVVNLVLNAVEALPENGGTVAVSTTVVDADRTLLSGTWPAQTRPEGRYVAIEVRDNGIGMDADALQRIFDPFYTTKGPGRGLGLTAVLGIVRAHGGLVQVKSSPWLGTSVSMLFPCAPEPAKRPATPATAAELAAAVTTTAQPAARRRRPRTKRS